MPQVKQVIFAKPPHGEVVKDQDLIVKTVELDLTPPPNGATLKTIYVSLDPYMKGRMRDAKVKSYSPPFDLDKPIYGGGLSSVEESNDPDFPKGTIVTGQTYHSEYFTVENLKKAGFQKIDNPYNLPLERFLGVLGMPGMTAYTSLYDIGAPKKGETIFISAAAGAVGSLVGQLAKREGLRVVGSAGSDEKVRYLVETLKFDAAFNYKTEKPSEALPKYAPEGLAIYYDNVGGETLEAAINAMNMHGRIIACGAISQYNTSLDAAYGVRNLFQVVGKRLKMQGFIVSDYWAKWHKEFNENVSKWLSEGEITYKEDVTNGIDGEIDAFIGLLRGENFGKAIVKY